MPARAALIDPHGEVAHPRDAIGDLVAEEHPAAARLRSLADDDLDRVRAAEVVRGHAAVAGRGRRADLARAAAEGLLRRRRQRTEAHAGDRDRDPQLERLRGETRSEDDVRPAPLPVALERVTRD